MCKKRKEKKTVYWDLINSNVNKRDVQTGCSGYVHKAAILSRMYGGARNEEAWNFFWTLYLET